MRRGGHEASFEKSNYMRRVCLYQHMQKALPRSLAGLQRDFKKNLNLVHVGATRTLENLLAKPGSCRESQLHTSAFRSYVDKSGKVFCSVHKA